MSDNFSDFLFYFNVTITFADGKKKKKDFS